MARLGFGRMPPGEMTVAELEASVSALPGKRDALREAFGRLAACSPSPLPFAWEDLDAHVYSLQSSISLRFRQVWALEAARAAAAAASPGETRGDGRGESLELEEEVVEEDKEEVEVEWEVVEEEEEDEVVVELEEEQADEEMQEGGDDDDDADDEIVKDGEDDEEAIEVVLQEEEVKAAADNKIDNVIEDDMEAMEQQQDADEEMQVANEEEQSAEYAKKFSIDKEEEQSTKDAEKASQGEEVDANTKEAATKKASTMEPTVDGACGKKQEEEKEEQDAHEEEGAKNVTKEVRMVTKEVSQDQGTPTLPGGFNDRTAACAKMDAQRLVKLIFTTTGLNSEFHAAVRSAPDAGALVLHVVELFLHDRMLKTNSAWMNCVGLIRMVPVFVTNPCADMIEQAKRVARDWNEMTRDPGSSSVIGSLASWGLLYFLISYNIVSDFEIKEIFRLFCTIPRKQKKMNYGMLFKGLGLTDRIPELMEYLIGNAQQMDALYFTRIFNLVEKYPLVSLLKGYVEKAKQTAAEISQKNMTHQSLNAVIIKELDNLRRAHDVAKQQITDSSLSTSIVEEINALLWEFRKRKQSLSNSSTASVPNSQEQHMESNKKHKKEQGQEQEQHMENNKRHKKEQEHHMESNKKHKKEQKQKQKHHEGQENQEQQGQQNKPGEKLEKKQDKPQQKRKAAGTRR